MNSTNLRRALTGFALFIALSCSGFTAVGAGEPAALARAAGANTVAVATAPENTAEPAAASQEEEAAPGAALAAAVMKA